MRPGRLKMAADKRRSRQEALINSVTGMPVRFHISGLKQTILLKILPVFDYKRRFSKEREAKERLGTCLPNNMFIISIRYWEEPRPSSRISGPLSCCHIPIGR